MLHQEFEIDAQIETLGRLPEQVQRGIASASRQAAATGYRLGLKEIPLSEGILMGYKRWFVAGQRRPGETKAWLGENVLRQAGDYENREVAPGRFRKIRADVDFPAAEAERVVNDVVVPAMTAVYEGIAEREIQKAVLRG